MTPIGRLARDHGISGRGLQKICERLAIPTPPRGYWAKLAAGKNVVKFRLPPAKDDNLLGATIRPSSQPEAPPPVPVEVQRAIDEKRSELKPVTVPKTLRSVHVAVQRWIDESRERAETIRRLRHGWAPPMIDATPIAKRRLRILSALFFALEEQGSKIKADRDLQHVVFAEIDGIRVDFSCAERIKKSRVPLTEERKSSYNREGNGNRSKPQPGNWPSRSPRRSTRRG